MCYADSDYCVIVTCFRTTCSYLLWLLLLTLLTQLMIDVFDWPKIEMFFHCFYLCFLLVACEHGSYAPYNTWIHTNTKSCQKTQTGEALNGNFLTPSEGQACAKSTNLLWIPTYVCVRVWFPIEAACAPVALLMSQRGNKMIGCTLFD